MAALKSKFPAFSAFLLWLSCGGMSAWGLDMASPSVASLRCEHLQDPLGIDVARPRLSWICDVGDAEIPRGLRQTAYQVLVASDGELLRQDKGDLWDSGKVESDRSIQIEYAGKPLVSGQRCFWKVRVWTASAAKVSGKGTPTPWSKPASWTMGILHAEDWKSEWIGMASAQAEDCPWFRKTFTLEAVPSQALAFVASIGFHELYVNGRKVGDQVLAPSVSDLRKRALYVTYDIAPFLRPGRNAVTVWAAPGWASLNVRNPKSDPPFQSFINAFQVDKPSLVRVRLQCGDALHAPRVFGSDASWRCARSHVTHRGKWQYMDFGGDRMDLSQEPEGWSTAAFDDSAWKAATIYHSGLILSADTIEPNRICDTIPAVRVKQTAPGVHRYEMAKLFTGWIEVKMKGRPGTKVVIYVSSVPNETVEFNQMNVCIIGPSGQAIFRNRFSYHECRFVTVSGLEQPPELTEVVGYRVNNDRKPTGDFQCSNDLLNRIRDITVNTYINLSTGGMTVDCPHRERLGYGGDGHTSLEIALDAFSSAPFFSKWTQDWCDMQEPDGRIFHTAPTMGGGGGPAWSGFVVVMPWETYLTYGDRRILEKAFPVAERWLDFLVKHQSDEGLLNPLPGGKWMFLGDWLTPHGKEGSSSPEALLFNNCYLHYILRLMAKIASIVEKPEEGKRFLARAEHLRQAINKKFFDASTGSYLGGRQTHQVMPLIAGVVPDGQVDLVMRRLEHEIVVARKGHLDTGVHGTYFMTKLLTDMGRSDLVFTYATQKTYPGYGDLIAKGNTTWPENWQGTGSLMHGCMNGIGGWFQRGLAGIRPDLSAPGFKHIIIKPAIAGDLTWVKGAFDSPHGHVVSNWRREGDQLMMEVVIPPNATATIYVPTVNEKTVTESDQPLSQSNGLRFERMDHGAAVCRVGAGRYRFQSALPPLPKSGQTIK